MSAPDRLGAAEEALRKVQAQAAALEELSEQLSLSVHVLEAEIAALAKQAWSGPSDVPAASRAAAPAARSQRSTDIEGARLVALNMALEGEPREAVDKYLGEHFDIGEREQLLDEVYAAVGA